MAGRCQRSVPAIVRSNVVGPDDAGFLGFLSCHQAAPFHRIPNAAKRHTRTLPAAARRERCRGGARLRIRTCRARGRHVLPCCGARAAWTPVPSPIAAEPLNPASTLRSRARRGPHTGTLRTCRFVQRLDDRHARGPHGGKHVANLVLRFHPHTEVKPRRHRLRCRVIHQCEKEAPVSGHERDLAVCALRREAEPAAVEALGEAAVAHMEVKVADVHRCTIDKAGLYARPRRAHFRITAAAVSSGSRRDPQSVREGAPVRDRVRL